MRLVSSQHSWQLKITRATVLWCLAPQTAQLTAFYYRPCTLLVHAHRAIRHMCMCVVCGLNSLWSIWLLITLTLSRSSWNIKVKGQRLIKVVIDLECIVLSSQLCIGINRHPTTASIIDCQDKYSVDRRSAWLTHHVWSTPAALSNATSRTILSTKSKHGSCSICFDLLISDTDFRKHEISRQTRLTSLPQPRAL